MDNKILSKIKRLLSLATSDNPAEAKLASEKAMELMIKHNIELKDAERDESVNHFTVYESRESQETKFISQILMNCFFVSMTRRRKYCPETKKVLTANTIIGEETNLEIAKYSFDFLTTEFRRLWKNYRKSTGATAREKQSYYLGLTIGFEKVFKEQKNYSENKYQVVVSKNDELLDEYIKNVIGAKGTHNTNIKNRSRNALNDGKKQGEEIKIHKGVTSKSTNNGLLLA